YAGLAVVAVTAGQPAILARAGGVAGRACSGHAGAGVRYRPEGGVLSAACVDFSGRESVVLLLPGFADEYLDESAVPVWWHRCGHCGRRFILIRAGVVAEIGRAHV